MSGGFLYNIETNEVWQNSKRHADKANDCVIIRNRKHMAERYGLKGLISVAERLFSEGEVINPEWTANELLDAVWNKMIGIVNEYNDTQRSLKRKTSPKVPRESREPRPRGPKSVRKRRTRTYRIRFEAIGEELRPNSGRQIAHQPAAILERLRSQSSEILTEDELKAIIYKMAEDGELKTKQDPWRIWLYYECSLHNRNLVNRRIEF